MSNEDHSPTDAAAFGWLGPLRGRMRAAFFRVLRQAFTTDDGRRILTDAYSGLPLPSRVPLFRERDACIAVQPYANLGRSQETHCAPEGSKPVFITARFRTGSTLLWLIFRNISGCRAYYEPLNERRWFEHRTRGEHTDPTHVGVSDYWREYDGLDALSRVYDEAWTFRDLHMDEFTWNPALHTYVQTLIDAAEPARPILQFNRVDFRLPWLRRHFPDALIIHLYRHPRDQWCSALGDLTSVPPDAPIAAFARHDHFYLLSWVRDLRYQFPFLDEDVLTHAYDLFYLIWKLSWACGRRYAHYSVEFERLVSTPETELTALFDAISLRGADVPQLARLVSSRPCGKWRAYATDEWFEQRESACETLLRDYFGCGRPSPANDALDEYANVAFG